MGTKTWSANYQGHRIVVTNHFQWFPMRTWECLHLPGQPVQRSDGSVFPTSATVFGWLDAASGKVLVEARIGHVVGGLRAGCHILVDGVLIGGDVDKKLNHHDPKSWNETREKGVVRFLATRGLLGMGLPFALMMMFINDTGEGIARLLLFVFHAVFFGGAMGLFFWRAGNVQAAAYQEALQRVRSDDARLRRSDR
jgi:hypothetical protein